MNTKKLIWTVGHIERMYREQTVLFFERSLRRKEEMWPNVQKSLLIHSMLMDYPIPNVYALREYNGQLDGRNKPLFNYYILDGRQRLASILSYIRGDFPLDDSTPNILVEDTEYEVAGKYFCDLNESVQFEIKRYKFEIIALVECGNREMEEIFLRLNNCASLIRFQTAEARGDGELAEMIKELLSSSFFRVSCNFTEAQRKAGDDRRALLQSMMLLDTRYAAKLEWRDFSEASIREYVESVCRNYSDKQRNLLKSAIQYLEDAFPEKNGQLREISVPMLVYLADIAEDAEIKPEFIRQWWEFFTEEEACMEPYKTFCSSGGCETERIKDRLSILVKSFTTYHGIEIFDEPKEMAAETEK